MKLGDGPGRLGWFPHKNTKKSLRQQERTAQLGARGLFRREGPASYHTFHLDTRAHTRWWRDHPLKEFCLSRRGGPSPTNPAQPARCATSEPISLAERTHGENVIPFASVIRQRKPLHSSSDS